MVVVVLASEPVVFAVTSFVSVLMVAEISIGAPILRPSRSVMLEGASPTALPAPAAAVAKEDVVVYTPLTKLSASATPHSLSTLSMRVQAVHVPLSLLTLTRHVYPHSVMSSSRVQNLPESSGRKKDDGLVRNDWGTALGIVCTSWIMMGQGVWRMVGRQQSVQVGMSVVRHIVSLSCLCSAELGGSGGV